MLLHDKVFFLISGHYVEQHFVSQHRIRGSHPKDHSGDGCVGWEADVVEGDSQREQETRRRIPRELASYSLATAEMGKNEILIGWKAESAAYMVEKEAKNREEIIYEGQIIRKEC